MALCPPAPEPPGHDHKIARNGNIFYKLASCGAMAVASLVRMLQTSLASPAAF